MSESLKVRVSVPMTARWVADVWIPSDRLSDVSGYLDEQPEVAELIVQNGWMEDDQLHLIDVQIEG